MAVKLHKLANKNLIDLTFEQITVMDQMICSRRQINFLKFTETILEPLA
jgi:hypothetical protein